MIRPFTCICLVLAAGSGLYLYQVKQRAFALDADLRSTFHDIDMARQKTRMLRADWALMNDPERLQSLSAQYLTLKPMGPSQLMTLDQLAVALPAPVKPGSMPQPVDPDEALPAAPATDPTHGVPMAEATPVPAPASAQPSSGPAVAMLEADSPNAVSSVTPPPAPPAGPAAAASAAVAASAAAEAAAAVTQAPDTSAPVSALPKVASVVPPADATVGHVTTHHTVKHTQAAAARPAGSALAQVGDTPAVQTVKPHHAHHKTPAPKPDTQYFAANEPTHPAAYGGTRITPPAATVMYSPVASSLGMASSAALAPPRPLYSTTQ